MVAATQAHVAIGDGLVGTDAEPLALLGRERLRGNIFHRLGHELRRRREMMLPHQCSRLVVALGLARISAFRV